MNPIKLSENIEQDLICLKAVNLNSANLADAIFNIVNLQRERLSEFLPWVKYIKSVTDEENYFKMMDKLSNEMKAFDYIILVNSKNENNAQLALFKVAVAGAIGVPEINWNASNCEIGFWISKDFEGQGVVSQSITILENYLFEQGIKRIEVRCTEGNNRSIAVTQKMNYIYEGTLRKNIFEDGIYKNTLVYSKLS